MKIPVFQSSDQDTGERPLWSPSKVLKGLTCLNDFLCNPTWDDGTRKGETSLMVFFKSGSVTAIVKVEVPALKLVCAGPTFDEALAALEASLGLPRCPFQHDDNPLGRGKRKK